MDLMFQWFWLVKTAVMAAALYAIYRLYKSKFKSKFWLIASGVLFLFQIISPVKLDVDTRSQTNTANRSIADSKVLPEKITDDSFREAVNGDIGITSEDLK